MKNFWLSSDEDEQYFKSKLINTTLIKEAIECEKRWKQLKLFQDALVIYNLKKSRLVKYGYINGISS